MTPKVSVILSAYNADNYIDLAVESILCQTMEDLELHLIDDASEDQTQDRVKYWAAQDARIIAHRNKSNLGLTRSLNLGIKQARGEYIARMDADDISHPDRFAEQVQFLDSHSDFCLVGSNEAVCDKGGRLIRVGRGTLCFDMFRYLSYFAPPISHSSAMFRRSIYTDHGLLYDETMRAAQDFEFWQRLQDHGKACRLEEILVTIRNHPSSISNAHSREQNQDSQRAASARIKKDFPELTPSELSAISKFCFQSGQIENRDVTAAILAMDEMLKQFVARTRMSARLHRKLTTLHCNRVLIAIMRRHSVSRQATILPALWGLKKHWNLLLIEMIQIAHRRIFPASMVPNLSGEKGRSSTINTAQSDQLHIDHSGGDRL